MERKQNYPTVVRFYFQNQWTMTDFNLTKQRINYFLQK